jgi:hypothetical protein
MTKNNLQKGGLSIYCTGDEFTITAEALIISMIFAHFVKSLCE